jgi:hypothetical protein
VAGPIVVAIDGDNRGLSSAVSGSESKLRGLGRVAGTVGRAVGAGLLVAGAGAVALGTKTVKLASDAEQSLGATGTVFGKFSDRVVKDSNRAALQYGLSANSYRENANLIGSLFRNQGVDADKLAGKTRGMISTAADLAATFGGPTSDAVEALGSAFKGEFDPLERYGVSIKQSAINAELAARGQEKLEGAALKAAQQQATSRLIMEQSSRTVGAFGRESDTLANRQQVLGAQLENVGVKIGRALTPALTDLGTAVIDDVMPGLSKLADKYAPKVAGWIDKLADNIPDLVSGFRDAGSGSGDLGGHLSKIGDDFDKLQPAIEKIGDSMPGLNDGLRVGSVVTGFLADHTDKLGKAMPFLVAGLAAYKTAQLANQVVGRDSLAGFALQLGATRSLTTANRQLAASLQGVNTASGGTVAGAGKAATKVSKLGGAAKIAGGAAGIGMLTAGVGKAETGLGALETTAGAALLGFSVGGPWGAAIGAGAGGLFSLWKQLDHSGDSANEAKPKVDKYAASLDAIAAASGRARRAEMLRLLEQEGDIIPAARHLGIETNVLIAALNGNDRAVRRINNSWKTHSGVVDSVQLEKITRFLRDQGFALGQHERELQDDRDALKKWDGKLNESAGRVPNVNRALGKLGDVKPSSKWLNTYTSDMDRAGPIGRDRIGRANNTIRTETGKARADLQPFISSLTGGLQTAQTRGGDLASLIGRDIATGVSTGIENNAWQAVNAAADMVADAIAAARSKRGADAHSPSRKTQKLGRDMGDGLTKGQKQKAKQNRRAAEDAVKGMLRGMLGAYREGSKPLAKQIEAVHRLIRNNKIIGGDHDRRLIRQLGNEEQQLRIVTRRYDTLTDALGKARTKLQQLRDLQAETTRTAIEGANTTAIGGEAGTISAGSIVQGMLEKLEATKAFNANVKALTEAGLNRTALQQLIAAGVEGGSETAAALIAGGPAAIRDLNNYQRQLIDAAGDLGKNAARAMHDGGVKAAEQYVNGLESQQKKLERAAKRIANSIARQLRGGDAGKLVRAPQITLADTFARRQQARRQLRADGAGAGVRRTSVTVKLSADQLSQLQRGKQIRADLDVWDGSGGRTSS